MSIHFLGIIVSSYFWHWFSSLTSLTEAYEVVCGFDAARDLLRDLSTLFESFQEK